ncbi:hypothetical protein Tco_1133536 [Tanacetum coccineum]
MNMDKAVQVSCITDKLPPSWKDIKHTLKHKKDELTLVELDSHLHIEESLRVHNSDMPKGNNVGGPSVVNMVEHYNSIRYNENKGKRKHQDTIADPKKKSKVTYWKKLDEEEKARIPEFHRKSLTLSMLKNGNTYKLILKKLSFDEIKELFETTMKRVKDFVPMESDRLVPKISTGSSKKTTETELDHEGSKRQKTNEEQLAEEEKELSKEELQKLMMIVPVQEVYVEASHIKYPIIDWEIYSEDTRRIIRVGNHTEAYQTFDDMVKKFDRDDLDKLWSLVKERFSSTDPTDDKERTLWVELKRLFKPDIDDIIWNLQRYMHDPLTWRLYDTCGCHQYLQDKGHEIFMWLRNDYPTDKSDLTLIYVTKLQVDLTFRRGKMIFKRNHHELAKGPRQKMC